MLLTELAQNEALRIVDRSILNRILEEQNLSRQDLVDPNTAANVGKLVGARYFILGSFIDFYGDFRIDARVVSVETSEIVLVRSSPAVDTDIGDDATARLAADQPGHAVFLLVVTGKPFVNETFVFDPTGNLRQYPQVLAGIPLTAHQYENRMNRVIGYQPRDARRKSYRAALSCPGVPLLRRIDG